MQNTDKIKQLLSQGLPQVIVANAVGCTEGYISQLMAQEEFAAAVAEMKLANLAKEGEYNTKLSTVREKLVDKLEKTVAFAFKPGEVLMAARTLQTIAATKLPTDQQLTAPPVSQIVQLSMPQVIINQFVKNSRNEIVEVNGRSMATMTPAQLRAQAKELPNATKNLPAPGPATTVPHEAATLTTLKAAVA